MQHVDERPELVVKGSAHCEHETPRVHVRVMAPMHTGQHDTSQVFAGVELGGALARAVGAAPSARAPPDVGGVPAAVDVEVVG